MYLEAVLDGFNAVRARSHVSRTPAFRVCADSLVPFLACNFRESCIASPDMREMLLQTISILLQSKSFVVRFESSSDARAHLVSALPHCCLCPMSRHALRRGLTLVASSCHPQSQEQQHGSWPSRLWGFRLDAEPLTLSHYGALGGRATCLQACACSTTRLRQEVWCMCL